MHKKCSTVMKCRRRTLRVAVFLEIAFIADVQNHAQKFSLSKITD